MKLGLTYGSWSSVDRRPHLAGTGASVAQAFAKEGYAVALLARRTESLKPVEDSIKSAGGTAASFPTDVSDEKSVQAAFAGVAEKLPGAVEVAIFNASAGFVGRSTSSSSSPQIPLTKRLTA